MTGGPRRALAGLIRPWLPRPARAPEAARPGPRTPALLGPALLRQLELLSLGSLGTILSGLEGEHSGTQRSPDAELADHRSYQPGDDPRLIDWNAYARLDELYVRTSAAQQHLTLSVLLDCSRSMAAPVPGLAGGGSTLLHAKRIAAALGAVALLHADSVRICALGDGGAWPSPEFTGRPALAGFLAALDSLPVFGSTGLARSVRSYRRGPAGRGVILLLSDLLIPPDEDAALEWLGPSGTVLHLTSPADALPLGRMELRDCETGEAVMVTVTPQTRQRHRELSEDRARQLAAHAAAAGVRYLRADTTEPVTSLLFGTLYDRGLLASGKAKAPHYRERPSPRS